ncbi:MAG: aminotransferase class III-fold pyridoxal phosphate-dependent enzyme [Planctomycetota bacterium]|nr:aminotransferase class III-fold pyridoxal phosphate-dependent enzyme [Planctomycetota bacterium]
MAHHRRLAALIIEPFVLGPGGIIPQPEGYLERAVRAARKHGVLVIFDEVAVGMGRLGTLFAFEQLHAGRGARRKARLKPDMVCLAKGLTAGLLPLSAVLVADHVYQAFLGSCAPRQGCRGTRTFFHGHTFTGSALGCAAALAAVEQIASRSFLRRLRTATIPAFWRALEPLRAHPHVGSLRGRGLMAGIELVKDEQRGEEYPWAERYGHRVVLAARARGVNTRAIGNLVLAVPPLTITRRELALLGRVLYASIEEATK